MLTKVERKGKAIELRKSGLSYRDIREIIPVSKSTLSGWVSGIEFTEEERARLEANIQKGLDYSRYMSGLTNTRKRIERDEAINNEAKVEFETYKLDSLFFTGICLYWAEGSKTRRSFSFVNSDPEMVILMLSWIEKFLKIPRESIAYRLYIHQPYAHENCEEFWASKIDVESALFRKTVYKKTPHNVKKNPAYKGCFSITLSKVAVFCKVMAWQKLLIAYYKA